MEINLGVCRERRLTMSRRLITSLFVIACVACSIPLTFAILAESLLWIILSCVLLVGCFIGWLHFSRCPHCGRVIRLDYLNTKSIHCLYCGELVDLDEKL